MPLDKKMISAYLDTQKVKAVEEYDFDNKRIKYSEKIAGANINNISGDEEIVRAYIIAKLANELGYKLENIVLEKEYDIGRPKINKPRIDIIVRDDTGNAFLFMELKSPGEFDKKDPDEIIEKQLYNLATQETGQGNSVRYLVLFSAETIDNKIKDKCLLIDYETFNTFDKWKKLRNSTDAVPANYGRAHKEPYKKGGRKDLDDKFTYEQLNSLQKRLHNVLWGGGSTDDNDIFLSLVNLILAKIQDEGERKTDEIYHFQVLMSDNGEVDFESNEELFDKINDLYKRALKEKMNLGDGRGLDQSNVIDRNKFSLEKLRYAVSSLESYSFTDGKNSVGGKDILGNFFEGIVRDGFKQSKGQFFTHHNIANFMLWGMQLDRLAIKRINKDNLLPYIIDPSAGSGTFLILSMKFITESVRRRFSSSIDKTRNIEDKIASWFPADHRENNWAKDFIYAIETNFNLGTAAKVNMILHGDGSSNIFIKDGLLPFNQYQKPNKEPNSLFISEKSDIYEKSVNEMFDVVITNPPFNIELDNATKKIIQEGFIFGKKANSENLFIERWYQLLKENGRLAAVLPDGVFDTRNNKYIRLFIYKYFKIKAVVSLPQLTFQPYTSTKTSLLFAQKKTKAEIQKWNDSWDKNSTRWGNLRTRGNNLIKVYIGGKDRNKMPSIKTLSEAEESEILCDILQNVILEDDRNLLPEEIIRKYIDDIKSICKPDTSTKEAFGHVNVWWVFGEVAKECNYSIFMAEAENVGYKRGLRKEKTTPNDLYQESNQIILDDGEQETILKKMRDIAWD